MIKHIVMWNVRGETQDEKHQSASKVRSCFEGLKGKVPGLLHLEIGVDISRIYVATQTLVERSGWTTALISSLVSFDLALIEFASRDPNWTGSGGKKNLMSPRCLAVSDSM
ncbi:Dabb family protein [Rhizobium sp.]|uniref:Dabb family protein n=1 Tax=Rhizobium sp. TaxID=391 RepID=UPI0039185A36